MAWRCSNWAGSPGGTFDAGRRQFNAYGLARGRFVYWGRRDGTVCVVDVSLRNSFSSWR